jgi:CheY-like chemotaxis protein
VNVLVVQNEAQIASFIKRGLEAEGFAVRTACDGAEGLRLTSSSQFDLIILDLLLPSVSGEEVLTRMREGGSSVPVIVLTAKDAVSDRVANLEAGADDYLTKPFSFAELLARVRRIKQKRPRSPTEPSPSTCMRKRCGSMDDRSSSPHGSLPCSRPSCIIGARSCRSLSSWTRCGDTTTNRAPTWSRSTSRTCARNSAPMSWRRFAAWGTDFGADPPLNPVGVRPPMPHNGSLGGLQGSRLARKGG